MRAIHGPELVDRRGDRKTIVCYLAAGGNLTVMKRNTIINPNIIRGKIRHEEADLIRLPKQ